MGMQSSECENEYGISFWFCPLPVPLLAGQCEKLGCPWLSVSTTQRQLKYLCVINNFFFSQGQNIASYQPLWRRKQLCPSWNQDNMKTLHWPWHPASLRNRNSQLLVWRNLMTNVDSDNKKIFLKAYNFKNNVFFLPPLLLKIKLCFT